MYAKKTTLKFYFIFFILTNLNWKREGQYDQSIDIRICFKMLTFPIVFILSPEKVEICDSFFLTVYIKDKDIYY